MEDAVNAAVAKASESLRNIRWFEVSNIRDDVQDGKVSYWQLTIKLGFTLLDEAD